MGGVEKVWPDPVPAYITETWEDETFQWSDQYNTGVNYSAPFNLHTVTNSYTNMSSRPQLHFRVKVQ